MGRSSSRRRSRRQSAQRCSREKMMAEIEREIGRRKETIEKKGIDVNKLREALIQEFITKVRVSRAASRNDSEDPMDSDASIGKPKRGRLEHRGHRGHRRRRRSSRPKSSSKKNRSNQKSLSQSRDCDRDEETDGNQTDDSCDSYPLVKNGGITLEKMLDSLIKKEMNSAESDLESLDSNQRKLRSSDPPALTSTARAQQKLAQLHPKTESQVSKQDQQTQTPEIGRSRSRSPKMSRRRVRSSPNLTSTASLLDKDQNKLESDDLNLMQIMFCFVALGFAMIMFVKLLN